MLRSTSQHDLETLRQTALELHTRHLTQARLEHVARHGPIAPAALLQKLLGDELAWLRPLSGFIAELDERLEGPVTPDDVAAAKHRLDALRAARAA